jgi:type I restriction enzyme, S subunit
MGWFKRTIGVLCDAGGGEVKTGPFGTQLHQSDYQLEGTPVVMPADIVDGKFDVSRIARVSESHVERLHKHKLSKGDIVYGRRGDIGRQALVRSENEGWLCGTGCLRISLGNSEVLPEFLHLYLSLREIAGWVENQAVGATMPNLNTGILRRVPVYFPTDKKAQKKIVSTIFAYDDLIENNKRRIALLEKMAEEIYREWFVRLRFPGHGKVKVVKGVPEGWEIKKLGEILELCYGKALKEEDRIPGDVPVYGSSGIVGTHNKALVTSGGIIVGRKGNVGSVHWSDCGFFAIDTAYYVKSSLSNFYLYYLLQSMNFINNDAAVPGLNRNQAYANLLYLPPKPLIQEFSEKAKQLFEFKGNLKKQNDILTQTRDRLLPRLISGKLSVENLDIQFPPGMEA